MRVTAVSISEKKARKHNIPEGRNPAQTGALWAMPMPMAATGNRSLLARESIDAMREMGPMSILAILPKTLPQKG